MSKKVLSEDWEALESLDQYFPENHFSADELSILRFNIKFLRGHPTGFSKMIDFGAGPTIHRLIPFTQYVKDIYISEYLDSSIKEVKRWVRGDKNARNWDLYVRKTLEVEGADVNDYSVQKRKTELKKKIKAVIKGDIFKEFPLGRDVKFPLVTSFYCADAVTKSKKVWSKLMANLSGLVDVNGWLILTVSMDTNYSMLGDKKMPNTKLNKEDVYNLLVKLGYNPKSISMKVISAKMWSDVGISRVMITCAQKR